MQASLKRQTNFVRSQKWLSHPTAQDLGYCMGYGLLLDAILILERDHNTLPLKIIQHQILLVTVLYEQFVWQQHATEQGSMQHSLTNLHRQSGRADPSLYTVFIPAKTEGLMRVQVMLTMLIQVKTEICYYFHQIGNNQGRAIGF